MSSGGIKSTPCPVVADATGLALVASALDLVRQGMDRLEAVFSGREQDLEEVVHQTRVDMKRLRALGYLVQSGLSAQDSERLQLTCRELAQGLGNTRDQQVMWATLTHLVKSLPVEQGQSLLAVLPSTSTAPVLKETRQHYRQLECMLNNVTFSSLKREHVHQGLRLSFGKAERWYRRARKGDEMEALHRWRKWSKVVLYQLEWLQLSPCWSSVLKPLGSCLGDIHDLDVLAEYMHQADLDTDARQSLEAALSQARQQLFQQALPLGRTAYATKSPARRCRRLYRRWLSAG